MTKLTDDVAAALGKVAGPDGVPLPADRKTVRDRGRRRQGVSSRSPSMRRQSKPWEEASRPRRERGSRRARRQIRDGGADRGADGQRRNRQCFAAAAATAAGRRPPKRRARRRAGAPGGPAGIPGVGAIIAVASGKGGVGKSTLARQSGARPARPRAENRHPRCRYLRPVDAAAPRHSREAADDRRQALKADRTLRHAGDVDRLSGRGRDADDLARPDGDVGAYPDAARSRVGHARRHGRRYAARHRRRATHHGAAGAAQAAR